jgi:cytochrome P450
MTLPPGPRAPKALQALQWWHRSIPFFHRNRARFGPVWTERLVGQPPFVDISDPALVKQVLTAGPEVLHPGEGARILEPIVGPSSVILLDEAPHLEQRRLMLPAFKGDRMAALRGVVEEVVRAELATWPRDVPAATHGRLQALTLDIILRAVFGLTSGPRLERLRALLTELMEIGSGPVGMFPALQRGPRWRRFLAVRAEADELLRAEVDERRAAGGEGDDVLAMLLHATHEDGSPMSFPEIRDELVTALVAGHETTASQLAWALALLARHPAAAALALEGDAELDAVIHEVMRVRPVLIHAEPRLVKRPYELGGRTYEPGVVLAVNALNVHHDPAIYPDPFAFRPERFLERPPETYTFLPFGGGRRRCLGASFAMLEMRVVLRELLTTCTIEPTTAPLERARRRSITISPQRGAVVTLRARAAAAPPPPAPARPATLRA